MLPPFSLIGDVIDAVEEATEMVLDGFADGRIEQEDDFTSQLVGAINGSLQWGLKAEGMQWELKVLTNKGPGSQERRFGADLLVVQHMDLPGYQVSKGFLAQAKLEGKQLRRKELTEQARRMLSVTPESFLFNYGERGIDVGSASAVVASKANVRELRLKPFEDFLLDFMTSWVGDTSIRAAEITQLEALQEEHGTRAAVGVFVEPLAV